MMKKVVSIVLILTMICMMNVPAIAASVSDLQDQKSEVEDKKEEVTAEKETVMDEISELNVQISEYENEIEDLNNKIDSLEESITNKEEEIKQLEKEVAEKEDLLIQRLVAMYERGQTTYLDVLLSSENITSFISNYYRIEEMAEADQTVIDSIKTKQQETETKKQELEKEQNEVTESKKEVEQKSESLQVARATKRTKVSELSEQEKELQAQIDEFEDQIKEAKRKAEEERRKQQSSGSDKNYSYQGSFEGVLSWPISSSSQNYNYISSYFGPRQSPTSGASSNHGAIDIPVNYVPVHAAAAGTVVSAGWMSGYGNYIEIDHGNGYYTAYGHLSSFNVSAGQTVSRGQQIAVSGNTGISTGPHLHYEVYIGGLDLSYRVDPLQYTTHPTLYSI